MTRQEEILKGLNESWGQNGINISSNTANSSNGITVNNPTGSGRAVELNFVDGINPTRLTAAQIALLPNPQAGQIVYQTDGVVGLYTYNGTSWVTVKGSTTVFGTTNRISVTGGDTIDIASTYVGQTSITTLGTVTTGTWGAVIGQATMTLGSDATGDIYYRNGSGKLTRLGIGSAGQVLGVSAGIPAWQAAGGGITVGTTTITSGTSGRIAFNNAGVYGESANLFWDNTNNYLTLTSNAAISGSTLRLYDSNASGRNFEISNANGSNYATMYWKVGASAGAAPSNTLMTLTNSGYLALGLGNTNGSYPIDIGGAGVVNGTLFRAKGSQTNHDIIIGNSTNNVYFGAYNSSFQILTQGNTSFPAVTITYSTTPNVGIALGTSSPTARLHLPA